MQHAERLPAALIDEGQYRLLVEAVSDYAIFSCWIRTVS